MLNEMIGLYSRYYDPQPFLSGLSSDLPPEDSLHRSRVLLIVLGSSYTSQLGIIEDPSARDNCNPLHVNRIHVQKTYDARMIRLLVLGSSSLPRYVNSPLVLKSKASCSGLHDGNPEDWVWSFMWIPWI